jgi:hypothetical protein
LSAYPRSNSSNGSTADPTIPFEALHHRHKSGPSRARRADSIRIIHLFRREGGWSSDDMARHYGASAAAERAQHAQLRIGIGDDV